MRDDEDTSEDPHTYSAQEVSQGHTVLRTPAGRAIFIGGLIGIVVLLTLVGWFAS